MKDSALAADPVNSTTRGDLVGKVEEMRGVGRSSSGGLAGEPFQQVGQSWDCSQVEKEPGERDAMDWLVDDEMMRQREEASRDEEDTAVRRSEVRKLHVEKAHSAPGLVVRRHK